MSWLNEISKPNILTKSFLMDELKLCILQVKRIKCAELNVYSIIYILFCKQKSKNKQHTDIEFHVKILMRSTEIKECRSIFQITLF